MPGITVGKDQREEMAEPEHRLQVLESETKAANEYFLSLSPEDLQTPSACAEWTAADVMGHLAGQEHASRVRRGLQGDYAPEPGAPAVAYHDEDQFARNIAARAQATREQHGDGLVAYLVQRLEETVAVFNTAGPDDWDKLCYWPPGPEPVRTMLDQRIADRKSVV